jgi:pimeloyl-ACP methyl ester carboxylesterase
MGRLRVDFAAFSNNAMTRLVLAIETDGVGNASPRRSDRRDSGDRRSEDADVVIAGCRATVAGIPNARLGELAGTTHLPNIEVPVAFNLVLADFLAGL